MKWHFPSLDNPSLFVGSPEDVGYIRKDVRIEFEYLRKEAIGETELELYFWEDETFEKGFDHNRPYQAGIPLPSDELCRAAIFVFGERIGSTLPPDFPTHALLGTQALNPLNKHLLQLPGIALKDDGFPLTGSTFEYLVAEKAGREVLVLFVGDDSLQSDDPPEDQNWGMKHYDSSKHRELHRTEYRKWLNDENPEQLKRLRNFFRYITRDRAKPVEIVPDLDVARVKIRSFLKTHLEWKSKRVPFKYLAAYDMADEGVFFGRRAAVKEIAEAVQNRAEAVAPDFRPFFRIHGSSGAGKSSLLRAGVLARLCREAKAGKWISVVCRPLELKSMPGEPLAALYALCLKEIDGASDPRVSTEDILVTAPNGRPKRALTSLVVALNRRSGKKERWRLAIGIDQFEELLDDVNTPEGEALWEPVVAFFDQASSTGRIAVIYTVPDSRLMQIASHRALKELSLVGAEKEVGFPGDSTEEIVDRSFKEVDVELAPDLRERLFQSIQQLTRQAEVTERGAVLPLLSLAISRIYERWKEVEAKRLALIAEEAAESAALQDDRVLGKSFGGADPASVGDPQPVGTRVLKIEHYGDLAELAIVIDREGDAALDEAKRAGTGITVDKSDLQRLLRRLVRILPGGNGRFDLQLIDPPHDLSLRALTDALRRHRLLTENREGRLQLVHEAVLHHWKEAADVVRQERSVHDYINVADRAIAIFETAGRQPAIMESLGTHEMDRAPEVLYSWSATLAPVDGADPVDTGHLGLWRFLIAVLEYQFTPEEKITTLDTLPTHFHAAVAANAEDLVSKYLAANPTDAQLQRGDQRTALFEAAFYERTNLLDMLLASGAPANLADKEGWLPLHAAATRSNVAVLERLLLHTTDVDAPGNADTTALVLAAQRGHLDCVRLLLDRGAAVNRADGNQWTALHHAANSGHAQTVQLLMEAGADTLARIADGRTALHLAAESGEEATARVLVRSLKSLLLVDAALSNGWTALHLACRSGAAEVVKVLIDDGGANSDLPALNDWKSDAEQNKNAKSKADANFGWTPLHVAADYGREAVAKLLLERLADPKLQSGAGKTPLHIAAEKGFASVAEILANHPILDEDHPILDKHDKDNRTAFYLALNGGHFDVARILLAAGARIDLFQSGEEPALHNVIRKDDRRKVQFLLTNGADPNARSGALHTALHLASALGLETIAKMLLTRADVNARGPLGSAPLHIAAFHGHEAIARVLVERGAVVDGRDHAGLNALHAAAWNGQIGVAKFLVLELRQDVDARDHRLWTPLHLAAQNGHTTVVELLLSHGAAFDAVGELPALSPLQAAAGTGQDEVVRMILNKGQRGHPIGVRYELRQWNLGAVTVG